MNAVIAKKPDAILIAPNDKQQLIAPLKAAADAGIAVICVDTFIDDGVFQDGMGDGDFPISYVASDNVLGGVMAGNALANDIKIFSALANSLTGDEFAKFLSGEANLKMRLKVIFAMPLKPFIIALFRLEGPA